MGKAFLETPAHHVKGGDEQGDRAVHGDWGIGIDFKLAISKVEGSLRDNDATVAGLPLLGKIAVLHAIANRPRYADPLLKLNGDQARAIEGIILSTLRDHFRNLRRSK